MSKSKKSKSKSSNKKGGGAKSTAAAAAASSSAADVTPVIAEEPVLQVGVGISFGGTSICAAVCRGDESPETHLLLAETVCSEAGDRVTPALVTYPTEADGEAVLGNAAKQEYARFLKQSAWGAVHLLSGDQEAIEAVKARGSVSIVDNEKGDGKSFKIKGADDTTLLYDPEDSVRRLCERMREITSAFLHGTVNRAVISVPVAFSDFAVARIVDAANSVGLTVQRTLRKPAAALLATGLLGERGQTRTVVAFDAGASSVAVTVYVISNGLLREIATVVDHSVGGHDFDNVLADHFADEFRRQRNIDIRESRKSLAKLRLACEVCKRTLTSSSSATVHVESIHDGVDLNGSINRARFELLAAGLFKRALAVVSRALAKADIDEDAVDKFVCLGGASRIPKVSAMLTEFFGGLEPSNDAVLLNDEVAAHGAAIQAHLLLEDETADEDLKYTTVPVLPTRLGVVNGDGEVVTVMVAGTALPATAKWTFEGHDATQTRFSVSLVSGVSADPSQCTPLCTVGLEATPSVAPTEDEPVEVELTVTVSADGSASVSLAHADSAKTVVCALPAPNKS